MQKAMLLAQRSRLFMGQIQCHLRSGFRHATASNGKSKCCVAKVRHGNRKTSPRYSLCSKVVNGITSSPEVSMELMVACVG
jgi:hypothetical protein